MEVGTMNYEIGTGRYGSGTMNYEIGTGRYGSGTMNYEIISYIFVPISCLTVPISYHTPTPQVSVSYYIWS